MNSGGTSGSSVMIADSQLAQVNNPGMGVVLLVAATPIAKRVRCATQLSVSDLAALGEPAKWTGVVRHSCLRCSAHQFVGASFRACVHIF